MHRENKQRELKGRNHENQQLSFQYGRSTNDGGRSDCGSPEQRNVISSATEEALDVGRVTKTYHVVEESMRAGGEGKRTESARHLRVILGGKRTYLTWFSCSTFEAKGLKRSKKSASKKLSSVCFTSLPCSYEDDL